MGSLRCSCLLSCFWVVGVFLLLPIIFCVVCYIFGFGVLFLGFCVGGCATIAT